MRNRLRITIPGLYAVVAIITFGHAAVESDRWFDANCKAVEQRVNDLRCYGPSSGFVATFSALGWPLYWSWEAWS